MIRSLEDDHVPILLMNEHHHNLIAATEKADDNRYLFEHEERLYLCVTDSHNPNHVVIGDATSEEDCTKLWNEMVWDGENPLAVAVENRSEFDRLFGHTQTAF